jgi:hypothetical protein
MIGFWLTMITALVFLLAASSADSPPPNNPPVIAMEHPGTITFIDLDTGIQTVRPSSEVPESIAWYGSGESRVPVVRVESQLRGSGEREIRSYGVDGMLLSTTIQHKR